MPMLSTTLPNMTIDDPGTAVSGTAYGGPFVGPLGIEEAGGQTFIVLDRAVTIVDAVCSTATGGASAQDHILLVCVGTINNRIGYLRSADLQPGSAQRHAPALKLPAGVMLQFVATNTTATVEAVKWRLYFA